MNQLALLQLILIGFNCASLALFGVDKVKSKKGNWRVPESKLLLAAFIGPLGALAGMLLFLHKIRKAKFLLVPTFLAVQVGLLLYFFGPAAFSIGYLFHELVDPFL